MQIKPLLAVLGLCALPAAGLAQQPAETDDDPVVATIDGDEVRRSDLEAAAQRLPDQYRQMPLPVIYDVLLDRVIDFHLLSGEAERLNLEEQPELQEELERARSEVLRNALVQQRIDENTTEDKLRARYDEMKQAEDFKREEVHARHILLETEEDAKAVIEEIEGGAEFAEVAKERSTGPSAPNGGDLGYFTRDQMVPPFAEAAFTLEPGQITEEPVETQFGWHVIKVLDKRTTEPSFAETEPQLREEIARNVVTALLDDLRQGAEIERFNLDGTPRVEGQEPGAGPAEDGGGGEGEEPTPSE